MSGPKIFIEKLFKKKGELYCYDCGRPIKTGYGNFFRTGDTAPGEDKFYYHTRLLQDQSYPTETKCKNRAAQTLIAEGKTLWSSRGYKIEIIKGDATYRRTNRNKKKEVSWSSVFTDYELQPGALNTPEYGLMKLRIKSELEDLLVQLPAGEMDRMLLCGAANYLAMRPEQTEKERAAMTAIYDLMEERRYPQAYNRPHVFGQTRLRDPDWEPPVFQRKILSRFELPDMMKFVKYPQDPAGRVQAIFMTKTNLSRMEDGTELPGLYIENEFQLGADASFEEPFWPSTWSVETCWERAPGLYQVTLRLWDPQTGPFYPLDQGAEGQPIPARQAKI